MANLAFVSYCGLCFCKITPSKGGLVLSCGDFICSVCIPSNATIPDQKCPVCNKNKVNSLRLNTDMPEDVLEKMNDVTSELESLQETMTFQIKHYKRILSILSVVVHEKDRIINDLNRQIINLRESDSLVLGYRSDQESRTKGDISTSEKNLTKSDTTEESGYHNTAYNLANREYNRDKSIRSNQRPSTAQSQSSSSSLLKLNQFEPKSDHLDTFGMKRPYSAFENQSQFPNSDQGKHPTQSAHFSRARNISIPPGSSAVPLHSHVAEGGLTTTPSSAKNFSLSRPSSATRPLTSNPTPSRIRSPHLPVVRSPLLSQTSGFIHRPTSSGSVDSNSSMIGYNNQRRLNPSQQN
eukprot:gene29039-38432_t